MEIYWLELRESKKYNTEKYNLTLMFSQPLVIQTFALGDVLNIFPLRLSPHTIAGIFRSFRRHRDSHHYPHFQSNSRRFAVVVRSKRVRKEIPNMQPNKTDNRPWIEIYNKNTHTKPHSFYSPCGAVDGCSSKSSHRVAFQNAGTLSASVHRDSPSFSHSLVSMVEPASDSLSEQLA